MAFLDTITYCPNDVYFLVSVHVVSDAVVHSYLEGICGRDDEAPDVFCVTI